MLTYTQRDSGFVESLIRAEAAQLYERAKATRPGVGDGGARMIPEHSANERGARSSRVLENLSNLYRPTVSSSMTPMERFAVLNAADDPCPWGGKQAMALVGIEQGSLETLETRRHGAMVSTGDGKAMGKSTRCNSVES